MAQQSESSLTNTILHTIDKKASQDSSMYSYDCLTCKLNNKSKLNTICQCILQDNTKSNNEARSHSRTPLKLLKKRSFFKTFSSSFSSSSHSSSIDSNTVPLQTTKNPHESLSASTLTNTRTKPSSTIAQKHSTKSTTLNDKSKSLVSVNWSNLDYDKDDFEEAFRFFDKNGDGCITAAELKLVLTELGFKLTKEEIKDMIAQLDKDGNGTIEYNEFVLMMTQPASKEADEYELREAFKCIDLDGNGYISRDELKNAVRKIMSTDKKLSVQDIDEMMHEADIDNNGLIDYDEFVRILVEKRN